MTPEEEQALAYHVREIAKLLYNNADKSQMTNLGEIEAVALSIPKGESNGEYKASLTIEGVLPTRRTGP